MPDEMEKAIDAQIIRLGCDGVQKFFDEYQIAPFGSPQITAENCVRRVHAYMVDFALDGFFEPIMAFLEYDPGHVA